MSEQPSFFKDLKKIILDYFEAKLKFHKIAAYEKIAKVTAVLFSSIVIALLCFFLLFFFSISVGFYFAELFHSNALGFLVIFGIYLVLLVVLIFFRKRILEKYVADKVIEQLMEQEEHD